MDSMTVETYIALLHDGASPTADGNPVVCPFQPDGTPKPTIDHHGTLYHLLHTPHEVGVYDYRREAPA